MDILKKPKYKNVLKLAHIFGVDKADITITKIKTEMKTRQPYKNPTYKKPVPKKEAEEQQEQSDRTFVGGGWDNTGKYGFFGNIQINADAFNSLPVDSYGNVTLKVATRKKPDERSKKDLMVYHQE